MGSYKIKAAIRTGNPISHKVPCFGDATFSLMQEMFFADETNLKYSTLSRTTTLFSKNASGRTAEISLLSLWLLGFDEDHNMLMCDWAEEKEERQKCVGFICHFDDPNQCCIESLGLY